MISVSQMPNVRVFGARTLSSHAMTKTKSSSDDTLM
jgi:hypothetical protein